MATSTLRSWRSWIPLIVAVSFVASSRTRAEAGPLDGPPQAWWWYAGDDVNSLGQKLTQNDAVLVDLKTYLDGSQRKLAAVMVKNPGVAWWWYVGLDANALGQKLSQNQAMLTSLDAYVEGGTRKYAAIMEAQSPPWWWYSGLDLTETGKKVQQCCAYMTALDAWVEAGGVRFASVMRQFPQHAPGTASLISLTGTAPLTSVEENGTEHFDLHLHLKNLTASPVTIQRAEWFFAENGGWAMPMGVLIPKPGGGAGDFFGASPTVPTSADLPLNTGWVWSFPVTHVLFRIQAKDASGNLQDLVTQIPVTRAGFPPTTTPPVQTPVHVSLQAPVEVFTLSDGRRFLPVVGELVNGTGAPLSLTRWHLTLKAGNGNVVVDKDLDQTFTVDASGGGTAIDTLQNSSASLARFIYGLDVPASFSAGTVTLEADYTYQGACLSAVRSEAVGAAPTVAVASPVDAAGQGRTWKWGNGPGVTFFDAHKMFLQHRYAYDLVILKNGQTHSGNANDNASYYAWNLPFRSMAKGKVVAVVDTFPENSGNVSNPASSNNYIVVQHDDNVTYSFYVHLRPGSAAVTVGQQVDVGTILGRVGNAGASSEPHLHVSCFRFDASGHLRAVPMTFTNLQTVAGAALSNVPVSDVLSR